MRIKATIILILFSLVLSAQNIEGKWLMSFEESINTNSVPEIYIMEFKNGVAKAFDFDFDKLVEKERKFKVTRETIDIDDEEGVVSLPYRFINDNVLEVVHPMSNGKGTQFKLPIIYFRIQPTKTSLSKEEIENTLYKTEIGTISFEKSLENYLLKVKEEDFNFFNERFFIEKLDDTFVISSYQYGKRNKITLIKEVDNNGLVLVGGNEKPYLLTLKKVKAKN
ncbi:hypothetical protein [uncultured Tenacibaculum sp.]|uniref:hypothetical protein n=1 Tax=uncultured Tenacibaculum sp. TaxID=174713 RepID=UPI002633E3A4|nr:hypothetical protein [uncultured Tenacibaculum sp.]